MINLLAYPFGSVAKGRSFSSAAYRYGFNGQEKDPEIAEGIYTAAFWEYDSRLGRRWNIDPEFKVFPYESPYAAFHNNPIYFNDPLGNKPGDPDKAAKKFGKKVDAEMAKDKDLKKADAITKVEMSLKPKDRFVTKKDESTNNGTDHVSYNVADYYASTQTDLSKPSSPPTTVTNEMTLLLDKAVQGSFDQIYNVKPLQNAVSTNLEIKNFGKSDGTVLVSYSTETNSDMTQLTISVKAGGNVNVPILTNVNSLQIEEVTRDSGNGIGKFETKISSQVQQSNPKRFAIPYRTIGKPTLENLQKNIGH